MADRIDSSYVNAATREEAQEIQQEVVFANMEVTQESLIAVIVTGQNIMYKDLQNKVLLKPRSNRRPVKKTDVYKKENLEQKEMPRDTAARYHEDNEELEEQTLLALKEYIKSSDDSETILEKVKYFYEDMSLADSALDFLSEVLDGTLRDQVLIAKDKINRLYGREIAAGKNISKESQLFSKMGIGSSVFLRKMYTDVTGNPRPAPELFDELSSKFPYEQMRVVLKFFLKSLGSDLRSKGPSIAKGELWQLVTETRVMQSILGVFRFFGSRMNLISKQLFKNGIDMPPGMNFESLAKTFMKLATDRFPSPDKIRSALVKLGLGKTVFGMLVVGCQMRDAVREVDVQKIFGREGLEPSAITAHMYELWENIINLLNELEDEYEQEYEDREKEEKEKKKHKDSFEDSEEDEDEEDDLFVSSLKEFL